MLAIPIQQETNSPVDEHIDPLPIVRRSVRDLLMASPAYHDMPPEDRRVMAQLMVRVCHSAAALLVEEMESDQAARMPPQPHPEPTIIAQQQSADIQPALPRRRQPLAQAQNAGSEFSGVSAQRVAGTTQAVLNAVSFPRFVTELINGVFKAMLDSSVQQMNAFVDLLRNVSATLDGFADSNMGADRARQWLVEQYPGSFELEGDAEEEEPGWSDEPPERPERTIRLRSGASMPSEAALRTAFGLPEGETIPTGDPERNLVPLARRRLAQMRQEMLATMVMLGMQRIVIDSGRINAAMRFHIDTRSAAQEDRGSAFDFRNTVNASGSFGFGPWGASASISNTIGYVNTQQVQTTEEMNTELDLNSSVEIFFHTDYLPLNRVASEQQAQNIRANSLNPAEETRMANEDRQRRAASAATSDAARAGAIRQQLAPRPNPTPQPAPATRNSPAQGNPPTNPQARGNNPANQPAQGNAPANPPAQGNAPTNPPARGNAPANPPAQGNAPANPPAQGNNTSGQQRTTPSGSNQHDDWRQAGSAVGGLVGNAIGGAVSQSYDAPSTRQRPRRR